MARFQKVQASNASNIFKVSKRYRLLTLAPFLLLVMTGCGHNAVTYGDGIMLETTINPETFAFGVSLRYGKILTACVRENVTIQMQGEGSGSGEASNGTGKASASGTVTIKTGPQITGYFVDAVEAGKNTEELKKYINGSNGEK